MNKKENIEMAKKECFCTCLANGNEIDKIRSEIIDFLNKKEVLK